MLVRAFYLRKEQGVFDISEIVNYLSLSFPENKIDMILDILYEVENQRLIEEKKGE